MPKAITFTTAPAWKAAVTWVTVNFFDVIEAFRVALILYVLNPVRAFCEGFPWLGAVFLLGPRRLPARRRAACRDWSPRSPLSAR